MSLNDGFSQLIDFNFCEAAIPPPPSCSSDSAFAFIRNDGNCTDLRAADSEKANTFGVEIRDVNGEVNGVSLNFMGGADQCVSDPTQLYWLTVNITCSAGLSSLTFVNVDGDACHPTINYIADQGCYVFSFDKFT